MKNKFSARQIVIAAGLSAFSAIVQLIHIGYQSPQFGMWIDIVAISWIIAFFLFGFRMSAVVSLIGALMITLFAPDTWLGASMKWVATLPMWSILAFWIFIFKKPLSYYQRLSNILAPLIIALLIRNFLVIPLNYYYAIPIWTGLTPVKAMAIIPWYIIVVFNGIQGVIDVIVAWILVFKFKLRRFSR